MLGWLNKKHFGENIIIWTELQTLTHWLSALSCGCASQRLVREPKREDLMQPNGEEKLLQRPVTGVIVHLSARQGLKVYSRNNAGVASGQACGETR